MIVVDTSVWVEALRGKQPSTDILHSLLDADEVALPLPVRVELLSGVSRKDRAKLARALSGLPILAPTDETWALVHQWIEPEAIAGEHVAVSDLLIGASAAELTALVWSHDADFRRMADLNFIQLYR